MKLKNIAEALRTVGGGGGMPFFPEKKVLLSAVQKVFYLPIIVQ